MSAWIAIALLIISGLILILYHDQGTIAGFDSSSFAGLMASVALLIWLSSAMLRDYAGRAADAFRHIVVWIGIALFLVSIYTFRIELLEGSERVLHELLPAGTYIQLTPYSAEKATVRIRIRDDGHFVARTQVNNRSVVMLVDTGATEVILSARDARHLGIDIAKLKYNIPVNTANGQTVAARTTLNYIAIGSIKIPRVTALVAREGDLSQSLLGMSFLSRLRKYEVTGDFLILRS